MTHRKRQTAAFSLIEVLLAIIILGIGIIGIAALFPAGIIQQQRSADDIMGPIVANNAMAVLRSKLNQEDFGSFEDFPIAFSYAPEFEFQFGPSGNPLYLYGDWLWRRPGVMYEDDLATATRDEKGAIDVFSGDSSFGPVASANDIFLPFNPRKWFDPFTNEPIAPRFVFTRTERMYPQGDNVRGEGIIENGRYYWDCMFRRFQGRILVAIFVYRVTTPPGESYVYSVAQHPDPAVTVPVIPYRRALVDVTNAMPWPEALDAAEHSVTVGDYEPYEIPETDPETGGVHSALGSDGTTNFDDNWQATGQWFIDQNNNLHRVLAGRDKEPDDPVKLVRPIPALPGPNGFSGLSAYFYDRIPGSGFVGAENIVTNIWYIPTVVDVDIDDDGNVDTPIRLTPVFIMVEEL